ncbi:unnamed protein product [Adineta steineri]|uniref:Uncharacterized protein n=1 Tax=Adineta steineri TaxID=433720 RepID=A0A814S931_9BILA|nr:unnamed protein product [Adineta steineri]CAF3997893.1 unnamed protein product [Adineta steineri]
MDSLNTTIVQQIETYINEDNLKNDPVLANYANKNNGWIRLELLTRCHKLSCYSYDKILKALHSKQSNTIELSSFEPRCIRRRYQILIDDSIQDNRTVIVTGLPRNIKCEELIEFFNRFYPIQEIKMFSSTNKFNGKIHVIFNKLSDALAFVQRSTLSSIIYVNDDVLQTCNGYTLTCKLLNDEINKDLIKQNDQHSFIKGKSFSTRLTTHSSRVSFNKNTSSNIDTSVHRQSSPIISQTKPYFKSNIDAKEQVLLSPKNNQLKNFDYAKQNIVYNRFSYDFYIPDHLLKQIHKCVVISVLNPHCFTIQLQQDIVEFDKFQKEINDFYNKLNDKQYYIKSEQIRINLCVICCDTKSTDENKIWNRSQILDFDSSDNTVNLFYVDLGTWEEYVPINRLRHITDRFQQHQVFSLTCRLAHIIPLNNDNDYLTWTDEATNQFTAVIDQIVPEIEFLSFTSNGCIQTNLFVINSDQPVCVNDYMIHIKKAKSTINTTITNMIEDDGQNSIQSDEHDIDGNGSSVHPVIALYNRLGEILQHSLIESRTASTSSSVISSPSSALPRSYVKLIHVNLDTTIPNRQEYNNRQQMLPIIFVRYKKTILIPDFNIYTLLHAINPTIDIHTIENYAFAIRYNYIYITSETNFDIFTQLSSLNNVQYSNTIGLYPLDFVGYILEHYNFHDTNVFQALESAKCAQLHASDIALWFSLDNELNPSSTFVFGDSIKLNQQSLIPNRLPFSNRLINPA